MNCTTVNAPSSAVEYYWAECLTGGPTTGLIILMTAYSFEFLVGVPLNIWLIRHVLQKRSKVAGVLPADIFPFHMALTQVAFYMMLPLFFVNHFLWQSSTVFTAISFLNLTAIIMKPLLQSLVCVESYMAVVRPLVYLRFKGHPYRCGCLVAMWCINILTAAFIISYRSSIKACAVFLPVVAIGSSCSLFVLKKLKKTPPGDEKMTAHEKEKKRGEEGVETHKSSPVVSEEGKRESSSCKEGGKVKKVRSEPKVKGEMNSIKKKAFITIVIIQAVMALNYIPFTITFIIEGRVLDQTFKCQYMAVSLAAATICSYLHPLLYLHRLRMLPCMSSQNT